jgi:aerobic carbon-monoxide dehydrogenase medium subunit
MKPPPFTYHDPRTVAETIDLLGRLENAKLLAGGQSLMPMLNFRYAQPDHVIDLNRVDGLSYIRAEGGGLRIGAMTRHRDIEFSDVVRKACPLMADAIRFVGHRQTRNRGTLGGSLAHLDPAAELPLVCATLDATIHVAGKNGERAIPMAKFPLGYMTPAIEPDELLVAVSIPAPPAKIGFVEFARRHGDFAIVAAAVALDIANGSIKSARIALGGVGPAPLRCTEAEKMLAGQKPTADALRAAAETCRSIDAIEDVHAPASYRQHLATVMTRRALEVALK